MKWLRDGDGDDHNEEIGLPSSANGARARGGQEGVGEFIVLLLFILENADIR
jgi:hypothetical protein